MTGREPACNFTAFSDDLTDLSFDHNGMFLNLIVTQ